MKFYGVSKGDLGANVPKHADYLFRVPQLFGTGHFARKIPLFLHLIFGIFEHALAKSHLILYILFWGGAGDG